MNPNKRIFVIAIQVAATSMLMWLSGKLSITLPGFSVPITLQSMLCMLLPLIFVGRNASGGIMLWLIFGGFGLPVFAGGRGGYELFFSNSGGYLLGFLIVSYLARSAKPLLHESRYLRIFLLFIALHVTLMATGLLWILVGSYSDIQFDSHIAPYLPGLIAKSAFGALLYVIIKKNKWTFTR